MASSLVARTYTDRPFGFAELGLFEVELGFQIELVAFAELAGLAGLVAGLAEFAVVGPVAGLDVGLGDPGFEDLEIAGHYFEVLQILVALQTEPSTGRLALGQIESPENTFVGYFGTYALMTLHAAGMPGIPGKTWHSSVPVTLLVAPTLSD